MASCRAACSCATSASRSSSGRWTSSHCDPHRRIWRSKYPLGLPKSPSPTAEGSTACRSASTLINASTQPSMTGWPPKASSSARLRTTCPATYSTIWNGAPSTAASLHSVIARATGTGVSARPATTVYSRAMSCADGVSPCSGGRRSTHFDASSATRKVRLERPPEISSAVSSPSRPMPAERRCLSSAERSSPSRFEGVTGLVYHSGPACPLAAPRLGGTPTSAVPAASSPGSPPVPGQQVPYVFGAVHCHHAGLTGPGEQQPSHRDVVDGKRQHPLGSQDLVQDDVDNAAVAEHSDGVVVFGGGGDVVDGRPHPRPTRVFVDRAGQMPLGHPGPLLRVLCPDLLDRDVHRQIAVVFGEAVVDLDVQPARGGDRFRGLECAPLRTAHQPGDRKSGQRIGQPRCLRMPLVGEVGVGALAGLAAERQRMPDQKQLHPDSLACVRKPLASRRRMLFSGRRVRCADVGDSGTGALAGRERGSR